jgi:hypothetical protein
MRPAACLLLLFAFVTAAPQVANDRAASVAAMSKLKNLVGEWSGSGWIVLGPNRREEFTQTESVQVKLGDLLLTIDGRGKNKEGRIVHQAFAVVSYDTARGQYVFSAYTADGRSINADARLTDRGVEWGFKAPYGTIRYTIDLSRPNIWMEIGERSANGQDWQKFFEMKLDRK